MRAALTFVAVAMMLAAPMTGTAQHEPRQLALEAAQRIRQLQAEAESVAKQSSSMLNELRRLELQRQIKVEELKKADAELAEVLAALAAASKQLALLEAERQSAAPWVRDRLVALYRRGPIGYWQLLLATDDLRGTARTSRGVAAVMAIDRMRLNAHRETLRRHREAMEQLETQRVKAEAARLAAQAARTALEQVVAGNNRRLDELDRRRDLAARYIGELQTAQNDLQKSVSALAGNAPVLPLAPFKGTLGWPVSGHVRSRFGRSAADRFGSTVMRNGIEIATGEGVPVRAIHAGIVAYAAPFSGFGTLVIVDHGKNAFTLYGHLSQIRVTKGARVGRNETLGQAGRTPDGVPATYFELRIDGRPVDPVQWLRSP